MMAFLYLAGCYKTMVIDLGGNIDDSYLTIMGALGGLVNGSSRIVWGIVQDKYGFKKIYAGILICQLIVCTTITSVVSNKFVYGIWVLLGYNCLGSHFVLFPTAIVNTFGIRAGS